MNQSKPLTLSELKALRKPVKNVHVEHVANLTSLQKTALWVTLNIGSMGFFFLILFFNAAWIIWNVMAPAEMRFDGAWQFLILLFINNIIQILFMPLIMIGQNLQGLHDKARAEADFEVNVRAEREIENILLHLEKQNEILEEVLKSKKN
jgi:uncharacterized membrane protein